MSVEMARLQEQMQMCLQSLNSTLKESYDCLSNWVDPMGAYKNGSEYWIPHGQTHLKVHQPYLTTLDVERIRNIGRKLDTYNAYGINGRENRVSYTYGWGFSYNVVAKRNANPTRRTLEKVQAIVDDYLEANQWMLRQHENSQRADRDGEVFLRKFASRDGILKLRYVEPEDVIAPPGADSGSEQFGIRKDTEDATNVEAYYLDSERAWVPADQIQHRKRNSDSSMDRGVPTFYPVEQHLDRALKLHKNMSTLAQIQTAIAMIRKMVGATETTIKKVLGGIAKGEEEIKDGTPIQRFEAGTILNANAGMQYEFPAMGVDPSKYGYCLESELRAAAARVCMPEFMFSSNANGANYASTMVAEGPAVKMFQRLQWGEIWHEHELIQAALRVAVNAGLLTQRDVDQVTVQIEGPEIATRDPVQQSQVATALIAAKILSVQTAAGWFSLDYQQEQTNIEDHNERNGDVPGMTPGNAPEIPDESDPDNTPDEEPVE
jgi:hypothetical protein